MVDSFVKNKEAIKRISEANPGLPEFFNADWIKAQNVRNSLKIFCEATTMIQSRDATISLVIPYNTSLQKHVQKNIENEFGHELLNEALLSSLKTRFDSYKHDKTYIIATILNPCFKFQLFPKSMKEAYSDYIIEEICGKDENATMAENPQQIINVAAIASSFLDNLNDSKEETPEPAELKTKKQLIAAELIAYFQEESIPKTSTPAAYWKLNEPRFPYLVSLFKKYGTAPATSAEVERLFSLAGNIVTDLRKRLTDAKLEKLLFLNSNLSLLKN